MSRSTLLAILLAVVLAAVCVGQDPRGNLTGTVLDASGAVIPGVEVRATKVDTGVVTTGMTNESGKFNLRFLLPGTYRLTASKAGFKMYTQDNIEVRINDTVEVTLRLEVGSIAETVEVRAGAPLLETSTSNLGQVVDERRMLELPQKGGNPLELQRLVPGVVNLTNLRTMKSSSPSGTSQTSVNGSGTNSTMYHIDGVPNTGNDQGRGVLRVAYIPPSSSIDGFKMEANPYDASVGHTYGPVVNISTKSGTNELHGSAYYWAKNSAFDAMDFFSNKAGLSKLVYQDHRYGGSAGGPVVLPRVYNGRGKSFFFYAFEENRWTSPANTNQFATVPTLAQRAGDFSALLALGSQYQIYNPFTTRPAATAGRFQRDPYPGNIIPKSQISTVGANLAALWPAPNQPGTRDGQNNYYYPDIRKQRYNSHIARVDHAFSSRNRMFVRVNRHFFYNEKNALGVAATKNIYEQYKRGVALDDVMVLGPNTILNFRYGLTNGEFGERRATQGTDLTALGFAPSLTRLLDSRKATVPRIQAGAYSTLSNWEDGDGTNSALTHTWSADLTKMKGVHRLRVGVDVRLLKTFGNRNPLSLSPDLNFSTTYTRGPLDNSPSAPIGQELATMLVGIPQGSMTTTASYATQNKYIGLYFQDDFKLTSRLSLNLGLRYEKHFRVIERYDRLVAGYDFDTPNPIEAQAKANYARSPIPELPAAAFSARGGLTFVNQGGRGRSPYDNDGGQWLPRAGLAYQINANTVLRSGYGIYFDTIGVDRFLPIQTGFSQETPIQASLDSGVTYIATLANPFPNGLIPPLGPAGGLSTNLGQAIQFYDPKLKPRYSQRWSFGIQRALPAHFMMDVTYAGSRGTRISTARQLNATPAQYLSTSPVRDQRTIDFLTASFPNPFFRLAPTYSSNISRANLLRPYPHFGDMSVNEPVGYSWYHSLQVRGEKRFASGFSLQTAYTFSKFMQATEFLNPTDPTPYRVISDVDRPHVFTFSGLWELPFGRGRRFGRSMPSVANALASGWQLNGTIIRQAGPPLAFGNIIFNGNLKDIPLPKSQRSVDRWFNIDAGFERNSARQLANNIRAFPLRLSGVRGDGQATWNFSLLKNMRIHERLSAEFRVESYNTMNHPSFDVPNRTPTSSAFGAITNTTSEPRGFQFALKLKF